MEFGIHYIDYGPEGDPAAIAGRLARTAQTAEEIGAGWFTVMDHWFQMEQVGGPRRPMLEGYSSLAYVAAHTERMRLGLLVTGVTYRHPGLLAKTVTTLDVLSSGRAFLGIGAAWYEREHHGLGVPYPSVAERFERLEETLQICRQMWSADDGPYEGRHYQLAETLCDPMPISQPHPAILIGGGGERKTLRLVATYGDACNFFDLGPDEVARKLGILREHCAAVGRDYDSVSRTLTVGLSLPDDAFLDRMAAYAAVGIGRVEIMPADPDPVAFTERLGELAPALGAL